MPTKDQEAVSTAKRWGEWEGGLHMTCIHNNTKSAKQGENNKRIWEKHQVKTYHTQKNIQLQ